MKLAAFIAVSALALGADANHKLKGPIFQTSDRCFACHNGLSTSAGEDISIGFAWRSSMMANSSRDPYWQAGVRRESIEHPESKALIEDECSICHMPMARFDSKLRGRDGEVFSHLPFGSGKPADRLAEDGVSCSLCHQIGKEKLGTRDSYGGEFVIDTALATDRPEYGPFKIEAGQTRIMRSSSGGFKPTESEHIRQSEVCATCHTLYTKALGPGGQVIGELPEQMPYLEWQQSEFKETKSCQACHMPVIEEKVPATRVLGLPREGVSRHIFVGGNFFMQRMLNKFRNDLSVEALPEELEAAAARTVANLQSETAAIAIDRVDLRAGRLEAEISVQNLGGHKLPTAYPSRRAWLHVTVRDRNDRVVFESGALNPNGLIQGNDNDADPNRFEPHYTEITSPDQVQIYEAIMVNSAGMPTTGLLLAVRYEKDNRLLPRGFNKQAAVADIAVRGGAAQDADFIGGGDRIRYSISVPEGPLKINAELWFQPVSYRWANNLKQFDAMETRRFTAYYDSMSSGSAVLLAHASAVH